MKKRCAIWLCLLLPMLVALTVPAMAASNYTYNYNFWYDEVASPDAYFVSHQIMGADFEGVGAFRDPQGLFIRENRIYICDSGNNRILRVDYDAESGAYNLKGVYDGVMIDGEYSTFNYPMDLCESRTGDIFITDTKNNRVLHLDSEWNYVNTIGRPYDDIFRDTSDFLPAKLVVDKADRIYIQAQNVTNGLMEYSFEGEFVGYMGASPVRVDPLDYFWKLIATKEQLAQMDQFVPTEYNNICEDYEGFLYVTTSTFDQGILFGDANPVRRLNASGVDILVKNGYRGDPDDLPVGDYWWPDTGSSVDGCSRFVDVVALKNDTYVCLDRVRGRLFAYDFQGNLLYAFGGPGSRVGFFQNPTAIDEMGYNLFVLDGRLGAVTCFTMTEYGTLINEALTEYKSGRYQESAEKWQEVLRFNGNYDFAYIGVGRAALQQGEYKKAMEYFKAKNSMENYGKAYTQYRRIWMQENIGWIVTLILILVFVPKIVRFILKFRKEIMEA